MDKSRRARHSLSKKIAPITEELIFDIRNNRKPRIKRIRSELYKLHDISLSLAIIHKILKRIRIKPLSKYWIKRKKVKRYNCSIPGEKNTNRHL